jgi:formate hydrogenlyase transcriptional activator
MNTPSNNAILVVDDTPTNVKVLVEMLGREGYRVLVAREGESALEQARYAMPLVILLDIMMPGMDGFEVCRRLKSNAATADIPVVFMTALGDLEDKVKGFAAGGADYVVKPFEHEEVLARVRTHLQLRRLQLDLAKANATLEQQVAARTVELKTALQEVERLKEKLERENRYLQQEISEQGHHREIIGSSGALLHTLRQVDLVAGADTSVLIHGETGTGKELIARALHERSPRRDRPLVKLNCSAISAGLVESELFGHLKGAFTGASDKRVGRFELANGGTLFLDEVSELPLDTQTKLLRVLQEGEFEPVGSSKTQRVDVRVIAACNRDLQADVAAGRFRADLYYRLSVFPIQVPSLRSRAEDIPELAQFFLDRYARKFGKPLRHIEPQTLAMLQAHPWPGNIRDLQNTIERAAILSEGDTLRVTWQLDPGPQSCFAAAASNSNKAPLAVARTNGSPHSLEEVERQHFIAVLRKTRGVIEGPRGAARLLELKPSTMRFRIKKLGIKREQWETPLPP